MEFLSIFFFQQPNELKTKFTFGFGDGKHFTLLYLPHKRSFDLHMKNDYIKDKSIDPYYPLFEMSSFKFFRTLNKLNSCFVHLLANLHYQNSINIGKIKKHNLWLYQIDNVLTEEEVLKKEKNGKKLKINKQILISDKLIQLQYFQPNNINELNELNSNIFFCYKFKNGKMKFQGFVHKFNNKLYFINKKKYNSFAKQILILVYRLLLQVSFKNKENLLIDIKNIIEGKYKYAFKN